MDIFNINWLLVNDAREIKPEKRIEVEKGKEPYYLYKIGNSKMIELLRTRPIAVKPLIWDISVMKWFRSDSRTILVKRNELPGTAAGPDDKLEILEMPEQQNYVKLSVVSKDPVPIYFKMSYFPRWNAYVNGKRAKIYFASPGFMIVYGSGIVELKYERSLIDGIGWGITLIGVLALILLYRRYDKYGSGAWV